MALVFDILYRSDSDNNLSENHILGLRKMTFLGSMTEFYNDFCDGLKINFCRLVFPFLLLTLVCFGMFYFIVIPTQTLSNRIIIVLFMASIYAYGIVIGIICLWDSNWYNMLMG
jgi:hypothetical protein